MDEDILMAESAIEEALENLRERGDAEHSTSVFRNRWRKTICNEMHFLRDACPSSHVLSIDMSDVNLELE